MNWHVGHRYGQFMVKAWGKRVHEHEQYRNRRMVKAWCKMVQPHGLDEGMVNSWSRHGVKGYMNMNMNNTGTGARPKHGVKWYNAMAGMKAWSKHGIKWYKGMTATPLQETMVKSWCKRVHWYELACRALSWSIHGQGMW